MTELSVRAARRDDCDMLVDFNCRMAAETEHRRLDVPTVRAGVEALLGDPGKGRYFVACVDGRVVGQLMHTREWSDWRNGDIWWLQSVYVAPEHRRRGIFRRLYAHALREAEADPKVVGVRLYVERGNATARETYQTLGLRDAGYLVMERMFGPV